jgi:predicted Zn-dependent protease
MLPSRIRLWSLRMTDLPVVTMSRRKILMGLAAGYVVPLAACAENPALGRSQFMVVSDAQLAQMADQTWQDALSQERVSRDANRNAQVRRVGERIAGVSGLTQYDWEFVVFESEQANAWALPNGKVAMYTGMLDLMENDDQVATVVGHEVAHVAGRHAAERASQQMAAGLGTSLAAVAIGATGRGGDNADMWAGVLGAGATFAVILPYSRSHELEADRIGVDYMDRAGYRPSQALDFWSRMAGRDQTGRPPVFLSTHPDPQNRIVQLRQHIQSRGYA